MKVKPTTKRDLSDPLNKFISDLALASVESNSTDAAVLIASDLGARSSFFSLCRELRETGRSLHLL